MSVQTPGALPVDPQAMTASERLGVGLGVTGGVLAVVGVVGAIWWMRRKRKFQSEVSYRTPVTQPKSALMAA